MKQSNEEESAKELRNKIYEMKSLFIAFFEGAYESAPVYEHAFPVSNMQITDITFKFEENKIEMTITLCRPGILIGKAGRTIIALEEYLNKMLDKPLIIRIIESNLWRR